MMIRIIGFLASLTSTGPRRLYILLRMHYIDNKDSYAYLHRHTHALKHALTRARTHTHTHTHTHTDTHTLYRLIAMKDNVA